MSIDRHLWLFSIFLYETILLVLYVIQQCVVHKKYHIHILLLGIMLNKDNDISIILSNKFILGVWKKNDIIFLTSEK